MSYGGFDTGSTYTWPPPETATMSCSGAYATSSAMAPAGRVRQPAPYGFAMSSVASFACAAAIRTPPPPTASAIRVTCPLPGDGTAVKVAPPSSLTCTDCPAMLNTSVSCVGLAVSDFPPYDDPSAVRIVHVWPPSVVA